MKRTPPLQEKRRFRASGPLRFKKNDVLGRADPSASRKTTIWDERTPPLQEKRRFETSGPLRFKKNDDLGRADPSASRKMTFWDERTPPLQEKRWFSSGNFCKMAIFAYLPQWLWLLYISPKELEKSFFWFAKYCTRLLVSFFCIEAGSVRLWVVFFLCMKNREIFLVIIKNFDKGLLVAKM